jgi:hypothetical protein
VTSEPTGPAPEPGVEFVVVDDTSDAASVAAERQTPAPEEAEPTRLNAVRVRQLSALRRSTYRIRSYYTVALGVCAVAIVQLALMTARHVRAAGWQLRPVGYVCGILAAAMAGAFFWRRMAALTRELHPPRGFPVGAGESQSGPQPDFSGLSDGSQTWTNLEQMRDGT